MHKILAVTTIAAAGLAQSAWADSCADAGVSRLSFVVPYKAGGGYDTYARTLAEAIEQRTDLRVSVSNVTGGSGTVAIGLVENATDKEPRIGIFNSRALMAVLSGDRETGGNEGLNLDFLGTVFAEGQAWVSRPDFELPTDGTPVIASSVSLETIAQNTILPLEAIGVDVEVVTGYEGSADQTAALLRGEIDIDAMSIGSSIKAVRSGDLKVLMTITDGPEPLLPGVSYYYGDGSIFDERTAKLDEVEKIDAQLRAEAALGLVHTYRLIATGDSLGEPVRSCLGEVVETTLLSEEFAALSETAGREISPLTGAQTQAGMDKAFAGYLASYDMIREIIKDESR